MGLENVLCRLSGGKQMSESNFGGKGSRKRSNMDEVQGGLGGLSRHATAYLFWTYLLEHSNPLAFKAILVSTASNYLAKEKITVDPTMQYRIAKAVMESLKTAALKPCRTCDSTGIKNGIDCERCHGTGKVSQSNRSIARLLNLPWSTFNSNKGYKQLYNYLLHYCAVLDNECHRHFYQHDDGQASREALLDSVRKKFAS